MRGSRLQHAVAAPPGSSADGPPLALAWSSGLQVMALLR